MTIFDVTADDSPQRWPSLGATGWGTEALAYRRRVALSWWWMSELARRHPGHRLAQHYPILTLDYDILSLQRAEAAGWSDLVSINRNGSAHAAPHLDKSPWQAIWHDGLAAADPHSVVRELERMGALIAPRSTPETTPRTLTYRFAARVLMLASEGRQAWDCRSAANEPLHVEFLHNTRPWLASFPTAHGHLKALKLEESTTSPLTRFWVLLRGGGPQLLLEDSTATAWTPSRTFKLWALYEKSGRRVLPLVTRILGGAID